MLKKKKNKDYLNLSTLLQKEIGNIFHILVFKLLKLQILSTKNKYFKQIF